MTDLLGISLTLGAVLMISGCTATSAKTNRVSMGATSSGGYICPLTGEELPCAKCCPLNGERGERQVVAKNSVTDVQGYTCPITGEILPCPKCCPLNTSR